MHDRLHGVYPILATPFSDQGDVLADELRDLVEWEIGLGVQGLVCLGVAGEVFRLSDDEREMVMHTVLEAAAGRVPVIVGVTASGTRMVENHARRAREAGAAGLLVAPPLVPGVRPDAILEYFRRVGAAAPDAIVVVQDEPNATGVRMTPELIAQIIDEVGNATAAKIEDPPTGRKIRRIRELVDGSKEISYFGGLGGQFLLAELDSGGAGAMTGFAFPEVLLEICSSYWDGDREGARSRFYKYLPVMHFEFQPLLGVAVRKEALRLRGAISSTATRHPGPVIDDAIRDELFYLLTSTGLLDSTDEGGRDEH